jgi:uncharacterized protein
MSSDQQLTPWPTASLSPEEVPLQAPEGSPPMVPNIGHALIFLLLLGVSFAAVWMVMGVVIGTHLFGKFSIAELQKNTFILISMMAAVYGMTILLSSGVLPRLWQRSLGEGVYWRAKTAGTRLLPLIGIGIGTSLTVELLSNFLPIPKSLPIDDFFKTPGSVWTVAGFGIFIAPVFEELAFRGFLLPALANAWDWTSYKFYKAAPPSIDADGQPRWSIPAMVVASLITSVGFAIIHSEQLAHSWAPLAVLYCVSLVLCAVRLQIRSLAASALVHASYNFTLFATMFIATGGFRHLDKLQG